MQSVPHRPRGGWTVLAALAAGIALAGMVACVTTRPDGPNRRLTGTCEGACDLYVACKREDRPHVARACVSECREVFTDRESLRMFESLECTKVIAFVEGPNGRAPTGATSDGTAATTQ